MEKTFTQYLQDRIEELTEKSLDSDYDQRVIRSELWQVKDILQEWQSQQEEIMKAVGITQEDIDKVQSSYIGQKCIRVLDWVGKEWDPILSTKGIVVWIKGDEKLFSEELYQLYETREESRDSTQTGE